MRTEKMDKKLVVSLDQASFEAEYNDIVAPLRFMCDGLLVVAGRSDFPVLMTEYGNMREAALAVAIQDHPALKRLIGRAMLLVESAEAIEAAQAEAALSEFEHPSNEADRHPDELTVEMVRTAAAEIAASRSIEAMNTLTKEIEEEEVVMNQAKGEES